MIERLYIEYSDGDITYYYYYLDGRMRFDVLSDGRYGVDSHYHSIEEVIQRYSTEFKRMVTNPEEIDKILMMRELTV
jgi:hypothetical protein